MLGGLTLESFHGVKLAPYMDHALRRELWTLAHAHGALLALVNLAFAATAPRLLAGPALRRAGTALRWGALLMPAGFLLGGIGNSESDPSLAILLTPVGALLAIYAVAGCALAAWRGESGNAGSADSAVPARDTLDTRLPPAVALAAGSPPPSAPGRKPRPGRR